MLKVLIACEESQSECIAFRNVGCEAYSCDLQPASGSHPEWHIQCDVRDLLCERWDLVVAHPPCTYLSKAGACNLFHPGGIVKDERRFALMKQAADFFGLFLSLDCPVAIENPVPIKAAGLPPYSQIINPFMFGEPWYKTTCLWLRKLPPLMATHLVRPLGRWVFDGKNPLGYDLHGHRSAKLRSKSFDGVSRAMADQWGRGFFYVEQLRFDL